jgi:hypothetical protein
MKILFFSHCFPPEVNAPAVRTYEHSVRWVRAGHEVTVVTCAPNWPTGALHPGYENSWRPRHEKRDGIDVVRVWSHLAANRGTWRRLANYVTFMTAAVGAAKRLPRPDVVVATSPQFFCGWAGVRASRFHGVPLVLEIRDLWPDSIAAVGAMRNPVALAMLRRLERRMYLAADRIVTVGEGYRQGILGRADVPERVAVVPNGIDPARFVPRVPGRAFRRQWNLENRFLCAYVGTLGMAHGLDVVVRAAERLRAARRDDVAFVLAGEGAARADLEAATREAGLDDRIVFTGQLPRSDVPEILASADCCLVHLKRTPLFETVLPSKMFEIMAMQRPLILGAVGEADGLIRRAGVGRTIPPENDEALADALVELADNPVARAALAASGRSYVLKHHNRNLLARRMLDELKAAAGLPLEPSDQPSPVPVVGVDSAAADPAGGEVGFPETAHMSGQPFMVSPSAFGAPLPEVAPAKNDDSR